MFTDRLHWKCGCLLNYLSMPSNGCFSEGLPRDLTSLWYSYSSTTSFLSKVISILRWKRTGTDSGFLATHPEKGFPERIWKSLQDWECGWNMCILWKEHKALLFLRTGKQKCLQTSNLIERFDYTVAGRDEKPNLKWWNGSEMRNNKKRARLERSLACFSILRMRVAWTE